MSLKFRSPVGAPADTNELEYIAALHQTKDAEDSEFLDGSIEATDVKSFLMSRYGIDVTKEEVCNTIFEGLAGGSGTDECLDLTELVAILLIPRLLRCVQQTNETDRIAEMKTESQRARQLDELSQADHDASMIIPDVLKIILGDVFGSERTRALTPELIREIFTEYEELNLITDDDLVDEMIQMATGGDVDAVLDAETFARALTADVKLYDSAKETRFSTHYDDVFDSEPKIDPEGGVVTKVNAVATTNAFPNVDIVADSYRSVLQVILSFAVFVISIVAYASPFDFTLNTCPSDSFFCAVVNGVLVWLRKLAEVTLIGSIFMTVLNLGNNPRSVSIWEIGVSLAGIVLFIFIPASLTFNFGFFKVDRTVCEGITCGIRRVCRISLYLLGSSLALLQILNIIRTKKLKEKKVGSILDMHRLFSFGETYTDDESNIKQAAAYKVNKMVNNAYNLHNASDDDRSALATRLSSENDTSTNVLALHNYNIVSKQFEEKGGLIWSWKTVFTRSLRQTEGIRLNARLLIGNCLLFAWPIIWAILASYFWIQLARYLSPYENRADEIGCSSVFDPEKCYFPAINGVYAGFALCSNVKFEGANCFKEHFEPPSTPLATMACGSLDEFVGKIPGFNNITELDDVCNEYSPVRVPKESIYSVTASTEDGFCAAQTTLCIGVPASGTKSVTCLLGLKDTGIPYTYLPHNFVDRGTCYDYKHIRGLLETDLLGTLMGGDYIPRKWMVHTSLALGLIISTSALIYVAIMAIPSTISTTMKFRSGYLPSLGDPMFKIYRVNVFESTNVIGVMAWSPLAMAALIFIAVCVITFLCVWQVTWPIVEKIIAILIGIGITVALHGAVITCLGSYHYSAFYRKNPLYGNFCTLGLECWHIALSITSVVSRIGKLFTIISVFLGRIDRPVLAADLEWDYFPVIFRQSILAVEAHRHPYLERLGLMYMMKLRYGNQFGTRAGSIWRLLFVFALMPWLRRYRIQGDAELNAGEIMARLKERKNYEKLEKENTILKCRITDMDTLYDELG